MYPPVGPSLTHRKRFHLGRPIGIRLRGRVLAGIFCWLAAAVGLAQEAGVLHERIVCQADPSQAYALYLPRAYTPDRAWPLMICLDPAARGGLPVSRFQEAAERWGYVVMGSHNSRNYDWSSTTAAVNAMVVDGFSRFKIDGGRIYHSGFSGGARASCDLAMMARKAAGVIAFGAAFNRARQPDGLYRFDFVGVIGSHDMNYRELMLLDKRLDELGWNHQVLVFEGGHHWPSADYFTRALAWLELQAYKRAQVKNPALRDDLFSFSEKQARAMEAAGNLYGAYRDYQRLIQAFDGLLDLSTAKKALDRLENDSRVRRVIKKKAAVDKKEARLLRTYHSKIDELRYDELGARDLKKRQAWWAKKAAELAELPEDPEEALLVKRLRETMRNGIWEVAMVALAKGDYQRAAQVGEVAVTVGPEGIGGWLTLSQACSRTGNPERARVALERAVALGFKNGAFLAANPHWQALRQTAWFQTLLERLNHP